MKKKRKDVKYTTENGELTLRGIGTKRENLEPQSVKAEWELYQLCKKLHKYDLPFLITKRRKELKYETNPKRKRQLRRQIKLIEVTSILIIAPHFWHSKYSSSAFIFISSLYFSLIILR